MSRVPLIAPGDPQAPWLWDGQAWVTRAAFLGVVRALAARLPAAPFAINLCADRHAFGVAFAAALLRGQTSLLPPSPQPGLMIALLEAYPEAHVIDDALVAACRGARAQAPYEALQIDADAVAALVFTSGSTGRPQAHAKTWGSLCHAARLIRRRLLEDLGEVTLLATVPSQHMYGLETTTLQALACGLRVHHARPQFPGDVRDALAQVAEPRVLVTTPVHLRALCAAATPLPPLARIVSATAPLPAELAAEAEARLGAPVHEIYGCTEAGSIAWRRTLGGPQWRLFDGLRLVRDGAGVAVRGDHLAQSVPLQDVVEPDGEGALRFIGRSADLVKVAGKRASAADLTLKLLSIPGVVDGVVFQPDGGDPVLQRPAALVVAPRLSEGEILAALGRLIDPVFLPRPLRKVDALPRNSVGKLPHAQLMAVLGA